MSALEHFKELGDSICQEHKVTQASFFIGEPHKGKKLYLRYKLPSREFTIEHEDGKPLTEKLSKRILPNALAVMLSSYQASKKV